MIILLFIGDSDEDEEVGSQLLRKQRRSLYVASRCMFLRTIGYLLLLERRGAGVVCGWAGVWALLVLSLLSQFSSLHDMKLV
jgi:hypothetical protein